ncbi:IclR family transcriptional regulator [Nocardia araoensis]|uniref:IclR family transcriptional regulator n=1 Tax=Nocardia araoensis TaxID=228600 RepID=UPI0002FAE076|nr:IclR family transcriptional regulator [Nocardia araoensis]
MSPIHRDEGEISGIGRASLLLNAFRSSNGSLTSGELIERSGLPRSTAHRLIRELVRCGLLERHDRTLRLGITLFELGQLVHRPRGLVDAARPFMADLREATRQNVGVSVLVEREVLYVEVLRGKDGPRVPSRAGGRWPAHASCSGKAILAFSQPKDVRAVVADGLAGLTDNTITDPDALADELARIRQRGIAYDRQESFRGIMAAASPILGPGGEVVGALSVSGLAGRINLARVDAAVRASALAVSRELARAYGGFRSG